MQIREAIPQERDAILAVHRAAFGSAEGEAAGETIATLVDELFDDPTAQPLLSLVAETDGSLLGHILFTPVRLVDEAHRGGYILAPLAVSPERQAGGIGSALIQAGLAQLRERGARYCLVLGDPAYYSRAGFAAGHAIRAPHDIAYPEAWMAQALVEGGLADVTGTLQCADALNAPEHW